MYLYIYTLWNLVGDIRYIQLDYFGYLITRLTTFFNRVIEFLYFLSYFMQYQLIYNLVFKDNFSTNFTFILERIQPTFMTRTDLKSYHVLWGFVCARVHLFHSILDLSIRIWVSTDGFSYDPISSGLLLKYPYRSLELYKYLSLRFAI